MLSTTTTNQAVKQGVEKVHEINVDVALREKIFQRDKALRDYENIKSLPKFQLFSRSLGHFSIVNFL